MSVFIVPLIVGLCTRPPSLHFRELGEGAPIVLLHPGPGLDGSVFLPGVERLAETGHRVHPRPTSRAAAARPRSSGRRAHAAAVQAFAEELGLRDWTLYGHSFGGYVTAQHLVSFPDSTARLILACTDVEEEPPIEHDPLAGASEDVRAAFDEEDAVQTPEECLDVWRRQLPLFADTDISAMLDEVEFQPEAHRSRDWGELHALPALAAYDRPLLAIGGTHDR